MRRESNSVAKTVIHNSDSGMGAVVSGGICLSGAVLFAVLAIGQSAVLAFAGIALVLAIGNGLYLVRLCRRVAEATRHPRPAKVEVQSIRRARNRFRVHGTVIENGSKVTFWAGGERRRGEATQRWRDAKPGTKMNVLVNSTLDNVLWPDDYLPGMRPSRRPQRNPSVQAIEGDSEA